MMQPGFSERDLPLLEDDEIRAAHPLNTRRFDLYGEAQRMVSAKHSKFALVDLVNWLLSRIPPVQGVSTIPLPTNADEAEIMAKLGLMWLEQNAPERLKQGKA